MFICAHICMCVCVCVFLLLIVEVESFLTNVSRLHLLLIHHLLLLCDVRNMERGLELEEAAD